MNIISNKYLYVTLCIYNFQSVMQRDYGTESLLNVNGITFSIYNFILMIYRTNLILMK